MSGSGEAEWDVVAPFVFPVTVGEAHLDEYRHTNNVVYLQWLEQAAWAHSASLGLDMAAYQRLGAGCVVRKHELEYLLPTHLGDRLRVGTWISANDGRLTTTREYQIVRERDGKTVLRGMTFFVVVDTVSGKPRRMPAEFSAYVPAERVIKAGQTL